MSKKVSKKISTLTFDDSQIMDSKKCAKIKGGGYYCCTRNRWIDD